MLGLCFVLQCVGSFLAGEDRELVALILLCSECHVAGIVF